MFNKWTNILNKIEVKNLKLEIVKPENMRFKGLHINFETPETITLEASKYHNFDKLDYEDFNGFVHQLNHEIVHLVIVKLEGYETSLRLDVLRFYLWLKYDIRLSFIFSPYL